MSAAPPATQRPRGLLRQLTSYGLIGVVSNLTLYLAFLLLIQAGLPPVPAMTLTYLAGVVLSYRLNSRHTFGSHGRFDAQFLRFCGSHAVGYSFNALGLHAGVAGLGWPAAWVQAGMIGATAVVLFVIQRLWVFSAAPQQSAPPLHSPDSPVSSQHLPRKSP